MKYKSELIKDIVDTRGHDKSSLHYESECIGTWIEETNGAYPKLCDYESEWLNYINVNEIGKFPYETVTANPTATANNVVPYSYKSAILKGQTLVNLIKNPSDEKIVGMSGQTKAKYDYLYQLDTSKLYTLKFVVSDFNGSDGFNCSINNGNNHINDFVINGNGTYKVLTQSLSETDTQIWFYWNAYEWTDGNSAKVSDIVLIEGDYTNTDIPYFTGMQSVKMPVLTTSNEDGTKTNILTTNEEVELRGIGDVKDTLDCLRGELTQKVENVLLTGDEVIELWSTTSTEHLRFFIQYDGVKEASGICNKFINFQSQIGANSNFESIACIKNGFTIVILKNRLNQENVDGFKQWLKDNSVSITYQLEQEVNKTVDLSIVNQDNETLNKIKPIEGTMNINVTGNPVNPIGVFEIPVEAIVQNLESFIEEE